MRMRFGRLLEHLKAAGLLLGGRILVVPAFAGLLALLFGLGRTEGAIALKVVLVLASMPVGFLGLVPPSLFKLDMDFANGLWLASNASLAIIVPCLALLFRLMG
jgi:predicted permease